MLKIEKYLTQFNITHIFTKNLYPKFILKKYRKGEYLMESGKKTSFIFFLVNGSVEVTYMKNNGNSIQLNYLKPFEIFGDIEYVNKGNVLYDVIATSSEVTVLLLSFKNIDKYCSENVEFWKFLTIQGNKKLLYTNKTIFQKTTLNATQRFLNFLEEHNNIIHFNSLNEIAETLNVSYRTLTRIISSLSKAEIIEKSRHTITLK